MPKPSAKVREAQEDAGSPGTDGYSENVSDGEFGLPVATDAEAKRRARGSPSSSDSPLSEGAQKKQAPKRKKAPRPTLTTNAAGGRKKTASKSAAAGAERGEPAAPRKRGTKEPVAILHAVENLLVQARGAPNTCLCELAALQKATQLVALARRIEDGRREAGEPSRKYPMKKAEAIAFICPVHLNDAKAVSDIVDKDAAPQTTLQDLALMTIRAGEKWPEGDGGPPAADPLSVLRAYLWFLVRVLRPARFAHGSPDNALFMQLVPHLLRDLLVNHNWHIVGGFSRVGARGTRQVRNGLANMAEFNTIMLYCVAHYNGVHDQCGLSRTPYNVCMETINISASPAVTQAAIDAATKACTFVTVHQVTNVVVVYPNQATLIAHFGVL
jgi:hypothetical protein